MIGNKGICMCVGINEEIFNNLNPLTKNYLRNKCGEEIKEIFGGGWNYEKARVKLFGFKTPNEYKNYLARLKGFKTRWFQDKKWILKKYKSIKEYFNSQARERGFKDYKDYQDYLYQKKGFLDFNTFKRFRYKQVADYRKKNNLCSYCGKERDSKWKLCSKCRENFRKWKKKRLSKK